MIFEFYHKLGDQIIALMRKNRIKVQDLARKTFRDMGYGAEASATSFISTARRGYLSGFSGKDKEAHRTAVLLNALGVSSDNPIIQEAKEAYKEIKYAFDYPPALNPISPNITLKGKEVDTVSNLVNEKLSNLEELTRIEADKLNKVWVKITQEDHPAYKAKYAEL